MKMSKMALDELFNVGSSKRVLKSQWTTEGVPFYRGREISRLASDGYVDNELFISEDLYSDYADKYGVPKSGDIVITAIGTIGNSYIVREGDRFYFKDASVLWLNKKADISSEFINFWFKSPLFTDQLEEGNGATVDTLTIKKLQSVTIDLPPLPEQKRIVGILDEAFAGIATAKANAEKNLQNARALFDSYLNTVFARRGAGWADQPLGELCDVLDNKRKPITKRDRISGEYPYYGATGILDYVEGYLFDEPLVLVGEDGAKWDSGEKTAFAVEGKYWVNNHAHVLRPHRNLILDNWLINFLNNSDLSVFVSGMTVPKLNQGNLREIPIPVPTITEQEKISDIADSLHKDTQSLEFIYQQKIAGLEALKKSLMHQAFTGEL